MAHIDPKIALVIVTRNRRSQLLRTLESLKTLRTRVSWELIVIDNGSTDSPGTVVGAFASVFAQPTRLVSEPALGQGNARNAGWRSAEAQIVAYLDDDCYPARIIWMQSITALRKTQILDSSVVAFCSMTRLTLG